MSEYERITNVPVDLKGYTISDNGVIFDKDLFVRKYHDMEEKAILKFIGISAFMMLLIAIMS